MSGAVKIKSFSIDGLFGRFDVKLTFDQNNLVLVGENGSGKSTVLKAFYQFLTCQWTSLAQLEFRTIRSQINREWVEIHREDLLRFPVRGKHLGLYEVSDSLYLNLYNAINKEIERGKDFNRETIELIALDNDVEPDVVFAVLGARNDYREGERFLRSSSRAANDKIAKIDTLLKEMFAGTEILFLPTYRRIERDLESIFQQIKVDRDAKSFHRRMKTKESNGYIELVEFGMKDVEALFREVAYELDRNFRADLSRLTGVYLRDVIKKNYLVVESHRQLIEAAPRIADVIDRIDNQILPDSERQELLKLIDKIRISGQVPDQDRVTAHFLSLLIRIYEEQQLRESPVRKLTNICSSYLSGSGKELIFDSVQFELRLQLIATQEHISLKDLSSGEKQIISLFTHLYLSGSKKFFVLIDEPELSVSVLWQRRLLIDVIESDLCAGLFAVTHSPFVFENELARSAHSIDEFVTRGGHGAGR